MASQPSEWLSELLRRGRRKRRPRPSAAVTCSIARPQFAGAKTEIKDNKDSVEVTVTATDAAKTEEIRKRAKHVTDAAKADPSIVEHNGEGHGGGGLGQCEIVLKDTTITAEDVDGGSKITVKPTKPVDLEWLKKETHARHIANGGKKKAPKAEKAANP